MDDQPDRRAVSHLRRQQRRRQDRATDHHGGVGIAGAVGGNGPAPRRGSCLQLLTAAPPGCPVQGHTAVSSDQPRLLGDHLTTAALGAFLPPTSRRRLRTGRRAGPRRRQRAQRVCAALFKRARVGPAHRPGHRVEPLVQRGRVSGRTTGHPRRHPAPILGRADIDVAAARAELRPPHRVRVVAIHPVVDRLLDLSIDKAPTRSPRRPIRYRPWPGAVASPINRGAEHDRRHHAIGDRAGREHVGHSRQPFT